MSSMCHNMKVPNDQSSGENLENNTEGNNLIDSGNDSDPGERGPQSPSREGDFSEYLWMENEEEFEAQVLRQLEEEALMQQCIEAMQDEQHQHGSNASSGNQNDGNLAWGMENLLLSDGSAQQSKLNPDAAEFVPRFSTPSKEETSTAN